MMKILKMFKRKKPKYKGQNEVISSFYPKTIQGFFEEEHKKSWKKFKEKIRKEYQ